MHPIYNTHLPGIEVTVDYSLLRIIFVTWYFLIIWEFYKAYRDHTHSHTSHSSQVCLSHSNNHHPKKKNKWNLCCPYMPCRMATLPEANFLKKTEFFTALTLVRHNQFWRTTLQHSYHNFKSVLQRLSVKPESFTWTNNFILCFFSFRVVIY